MLIEKTTIEPNDIVTIKLITSEEIIARCVSQTDTTIKLQKILIVNLGVDPQTGRPGIQMLPYFTIGGNPDANITLRKDHIIAMLPSADEMKSAYIQNTSSLAIPGKGSGLIA